jgi:hypothetical protein
MAESSIFITWGLPHVGRESMGLQVFQEAIMYYEGLKGAGKLADLKVGVTEVGDVANHAGYMVAEGSRDQIQAILGDEAFRRIVTKAGHVVSFQISSCATGTGVPAAIERLLGVRKELGIT